MISQLANALDPQPQNDAIPSEPEPWVRLLFPQYLSYPFADRHHRLLDWAWNIEKGKRTRPYVAVWPREGGKSTMAELITVMLGARAQRTYCVYVRRVQDKADESVSNIATMLESSSIDMYYPAMGKREVGKFGNPKDWRRQRLRTSSGFVVDALGVDSAFRGVKIKHSRPNLFIFDDIDDKFDSPKVVQHFVDVICTSILPAGDSGQLAVLCVQNVIRPDGFFGRMVNKKADYLGDRIVDGPHKAIENFEYEQRVDEETGDLRWFVTGGTPTWSGQDIVKCQNQVTDWGIIPFRQEAQHEVEVLEGGMYDGVKFQLIDRVDVPPLTAIEVWVDPAITSTVNSNCQGIQADGIDEKRKLYRLYSWEGILSPEAALKKAINKALELKARAVGVETDQGGDTWQLSYNAVFQSMIDKGEIPADSRKPQFKSAKASSIGGKVERQNMMRLDYDSGHIYHVIGTHQTLHNALYRFPLFEPYDLADASFWSWFHLRHRGAWTR